MPLNNPAPQFGLLTEYDLRDLSGVKLFTRGASPITFPTFSAGEGVYEDALFLLNGRSSATNNTATSQAQSSATFGSGWSVSLTEDDKVRIQSDADFSLVLTGSNDALGFGSASISATLVGSDYVVTAPHDWTRGLLDLTNVTYRITKAGGASQFDWPAFSKVQIQDVTVFLRDRSAVSDADAFSLSTIEELDQTAVSNVGVTWSVTDDGYCRCYYLSSLGDITWNSDTFRDTLGFEGDETPTTSGGYSTLTSTHKIAGVLIPSRPYQDHHLNVENMSQSRRLIGGGYVSNHIGSYVVSSLLFDLDALLDQVSDYRHFSNRWLPLCSSGERVNFYQGWGDSRRSLRSAQVTASQPAYDTLYSSEDDGEYGRIRGSLLTSEFGLVYPGRLKRRVPVQMEIEHL
jgi:hypothetical protein